MIDGASILITGGTGSVGRRLTRYLLENYNPRRIIIYSRDEYKHYLMMQDFKDHKSKLRFFIGDVRDRKRLYRAFVDVDVVIHTAALKQVPLMEYNPIEAIKTNINGAINIIDAALDRGVKKVVALSTDKAVNPVNLYGATKLVSDKLFVSANAYVGRKDTRFSVVRYGNVAGSRGSVVPYFLKLVKEGARELPITDMRMTRFWITLNEAVRLIIKVVEEAKGGEIYVSKIPSFRVVDLAKAIAPHCELREVGIREGEKLHEVMITEEDSRNTYEYDDHFIIYPVFDWWDYRKHFKEGGKRVPEGFRYSSDSNDRWLTVEELRELVGKIEVVL
ncbi:MAG: UDP-N-acetylglucosamine 4,6-dehydratase (inverting) [Thermosulfidibacteraceae bacterium]|jgi:UDP-N-acetylglucosamine 4,6-dehydratase (inverting)